MAFVVQGCAGQLLRLPAMLSQYAGKAVLVGWDVDVGDEDKSFGLVLLLGRAVHCLLMLESGGQALPSDPQLLQVRGHGHLDVFGPEFRQEQ